MSMSKKGSCTKCGKKFSWRIQRPGDGHWDRWTNDDGDTLANWFIGNRLCWEHAFAAMPPRFSAILKTLSYEEEVGEEMEGKSQGGGA
ncbi:MAG TPA: hypothetical protein VMG34_12340 [Bacteroidota bacterium]|nr:hypothetical protein [Bacteroidota bacterium]